MATFRPGASTFYSDRANTSSDSSAARFVRSVLSGADIQVNGDRPWDIQVHDPRFYLRVVLQGSLGGGESYMDGWWDVPELDQFFARIDRGIPYRYFGRIPNLLLTWKARLLNRQSQSRATEVADEHYNLGNDLYEAMLDPRMQYTCGYWPKASDLTEAQEHKLDLICRKLHLEPGMRVLELGGGFGGLAHFMASEYRVSVVSYNISREQVAYARSWCEGLPVRIEERDYREAGSDPEMFHRVVAVGLCEHIGFRNYRRFLQVAHSKLLEGGMFLLHTIGANCSETHTDAWIDKYIFPNGMLPSIAQLGVAMENLWVVEDWHNFGPDYDKTLMAWWKNFDGAWPRLREKYGDRFYRMWKYYLLACAGRFRSRRMQLWQLVLSKGDIPCYVPVR